MEEEERGTRCCGNCRFWRVNDPETGKGAGMCLKGYVGKPMTLSDWDWQNFKHSKWPEETCPEFAAGEYDCDLWPAWETEYFADGGAHVCRRCGARWSEVYSSLWKYCPTCGRRVVARP